MKKMTMTKLFTLAALSLMSVTMSSCGDDDDVKVDPVVERMELLTNNASKEWLFHTQIQSNGEELLVECFQDDVWTFKSNGELSVDFNEKFCQEGEENVEGTWSFNEDATSIINTEEDSELYIIELTDEKLVVAFDVYLQDAEEPYGQIKFVLNAK